MRAIRRFTVRTTLPEPLAPLLELVNNLRWSWHPSTRALFEAIDPGVWAQVEHDPTRLLGAVAPERLVQLAQDPDFGARLRAEHEDLHRYLTEPRWYQGRQHEAVASGTDRPPVAVGYFSPEYGVTAVLPQYSGGLGILAGDHLKAASDLGVPVVGVGLLYRSGYFRQSLSRDGWQLETYPVIDPHGLPLTQLHDAGGAPVRITVMLPGQRQLVAQVWIAQVGRVPLLLLDSDIEDNEPAEREVTDRLYGGGSEHRLQQEMLLGIGGVRAIRAFCAVTGHPEPEVFHTNEGHAGFLGLERIRELTASGVGFDAAVEVVRAGTVFTTHTPVPAGIDRFPRELVEQYFGGDNAVPSVPVDAVLGLGAETYEGGDPGVFNMAVMGLRLAQRANGVARLHGAVSRVMFNGLWPAFDADEVPITSITNGVHAPTWVAPEVIDLARRAVGAELADEGRGWESIEHIADHEIWHLRGLLRARLVGVVRHRLRAAWLQRGAMPAELNWVNDVLDPAVLTIGFARRVPSYKRLTLMLRDPDRLRAMLLDPERPVQIVVAGKSHPADDGGKKLIRQLVTFADDPAVRHRIVFLPDYDMAMAADLYPGCDVWLNNPLRPLEACGTSGMKAALNGCLNLSVLDGWWDEMYDGENGWSIPTADGIEDPDRRDDLESAALYDLIEGSVAPRFYDLDEHGRPNRWIAMVRHTLRSLGPKVLASRMVMDYVHELYTPAAVSGRSLDGTSGPGHQQAQRLATWKQHVAKEWGAVRVDHLEAGGVADSPALGENLQLRAFVSLGGLTPDDVAVQVLHGRVDTDDRLVGPKVTTLSPAVAFDGGRWRYDGLVQLTRAGSFGYTVRVLPSNPQLASAAEMNLVALPHSPGAMTEGDLR
jgi:glycogen phosphorylase